MKPKRTPKNISGSPIEVPEIAVAPFSSDDADSVARWPRSHGEARAWAGNEVSFPVSPETIRRWHEDSDVHPVVARRGSTLVAYGELWLDRDEDEVELARIMVEPANRGDGIGRKFVGELLECAAGFGVSRYCLRVLPENRSAIHCYEAAGFQLASPQQQTTWNEGQPVRYSWYLVSAKV